MLVIDDDPTIRELFNAVFLAEGAEAEVAEDGRDGLRHLERGPFDVLLVDLNMPVMNGLEFIQAVRANRTHAHIPIVVLTADSSEETVYKVAQTGIQEYLIKTIDIEELVRRVEKVLSR